MDTPVPIEEELERIEALPLEERPQALERLEEQLHEALEDDDRQA